MRYEELQGIMVPKVGFGTWSLGGGTRADRGRDAASLRALRSALDLGYTHFDTAESYAGGHCEELLGRAVRDAAVDRGGLFLTSKVKAENLLRDRVLKACEGSLKRLESEYLDLYLIHWPSPTIPLERTFEALNDLVRRGKVRHLGVSNFDLKLLKQAMSLSETPIFTNQVPYSLVARTCVKNGVLDFCQKNVVLLTAYSPFEQKALRVDRAVAEVARAHKARPYQIALAWLSSQPRVITIPMSANPEHQKENLAAADIVLSGADIESIG
jgi:diketogulonate reductase-like aldo/keto reductase